MDKIKRKIEITRLFWYFVLFSILGLVLETIFCYITTGVIESRKGLIWGPFCPVYGVGAVLLISILDYANPKSYFKLFIYGFLIGSVVEYLLSYGLEAIYGTRFWDYSYTGKDINGRICTIYSLFWGILAIILMKKTRPRMDRLIEKIPKRIKHVSGIVLFIFLVIDALATVWAISTYETRVIAQYYQEEAIIEESTNWFIKMKDKIENGYFTNQRMKAIFPNLRTKDREGNQVFVRDFIKE